VGTLACVLTAWCCYAPGLQAAGLQQIYAFPPAGISNPNTLALAANGMFYGTTSGGGTGHGVVFRISTQGDLTVLASFMQTNGSLPQSALVQAADGALYGTTLFGGVSGAGTIFRVTTEGALTTLVHLAGTNGAFPRAPLLPASDGTLYGTTRSGGAHGMGTVFRVATNGAFVVLASFSDTNGAAPHSGLVWGSDLALYGTTAYGGGEGDFGTVFRVTTNGVLTTLAVFNETNGAYPLASLTPGVDGAFYSTTSAGGAHGFGTVFRVTTNGALTTLVSFAQTNGAYPQSALALSGNNGFCGTTYDGGSHDLGVFYRVTTNGALTTLVTFNGTNGASPYTDLVRGTDGAFYGSMGSGGTHGRGNIFRVGQRVLPLLRSGNGWWVRLDGVPEESYSIGRATSVTGPWISLVTVTANAVGYAEYFDASPPTNAGFYRATSAQLPRPAFRAAIVVATTVDFSGFNIATDSFDSSTDLFSTNGRYDPAKALDNADVVSLSIAPGAVKIGDAKVKGNVRTPPGGTATGSDPTVVMLSNGSVGDAVWVGTAANNYADGQKGIKPGHFQDNVYFEFPDAVIPPISYWLPPLVANMTIDGRDYKYVLNNSSPWRLTDLTDSGSGPVKAGGVYVIAANVVLWVTGSIDINNYEIRIAEGCSLTIYMSGASASIGGNGVTNEDGRAKAFQYFGLPSNTALTLGGNASFVGRIYAPSAHFSLGGGGANTYEFIGVCVTQSARMNGHFNFHHDEASH
jgi:uncharacterized repeat protein (TIGR03803 family)